MATTSASEIVICTFRVRPEAEDEFRQLLELHWPTLHRLGLVVGNPSTIYRGEDEGERPFFVEIFEWRDAAAVETAHHHPEVMAVWEPMGGLTEGRDGRPAMEFPHVVRMAMHR